MSDFHIIVIFNDYYTLIVAFLTKQIQNRYRRLPDTPHPGCRPPSETSTSGRYASYWNAFLFSEENTATDIYVSSEKCLEPPLCLNTYLVDAGV